MRERKRCADSRFTLTFHGDDGILGVPTDATNLAWRAAVALRDAAGHLFTFSPFTLSSGFSVTIWTKAGTNDGENLYWGRRAAVWNNTGDIAILSDTNASEVARYVY